MTDFAGPPGGHGLYMNDDKYYFDPGAMFTVSDDGAGKLTGELTGTARDADGGFDVFLTFDDFRDWDAQTGAGLGAKGASNGDETTWTFMDLIPVSTLTGIGDQAGNHYDLIMKPQNGIYTFQYGVGANDKQKNVLGMSGWFYTAGDGLEGTGSPCANTTTSGDGGSVCDFNLQLEGVPLPAGAWLLLTGIGAIGAARRFRKA